MTRAAAPSPSTRSVPIIRGGAVAFDPLPGVAAEIADAIGLAAFVAPIETRGGTEVHVPAAPGDNDLTHPIGAEVTAAMFDAFHTGPLRLPCAHLRGAGGRRTRATPMLMDGASIRDVALACEVTVRTVSYWRSLLRAHGRLPTTTQTDRADPA